MTFEQALEHHLLDHTFFKLFTFGTTTIGISKHVLMMWIVGAFLLAVMSYAAHGKSSLARVIRTGVEAIVLFIRDRIIEPILGHASHAYLPYFLTLFFFIWMSNLAGLIPYGSTSTGNISVTAALALCTFGLIQVAGVREQGLVSYVKHIVPSGLPVYLVPLLFVIEIGGLIGKAVSLAIRLFANMIAGHVVSLAFLWLIFIFAQMNPMIGLAVAPASVGLALFVYFLDLLVALLQAYIFTMLTALFVGGAVHPH